MWHFMADPHFGHSNIIKYCKRPFMTREESELAALVDRGTIPGKELHISQESTAKMTDTIFDSINATVADNDNLVILGDFCFTPRDNKFAVAKRFRDRINCQNVYLIWGNHDDRRILGPLFRACYDQYVFNVDGQSIFTSHYPARSWDKAHHGSWMLYGHVHNLYHDEDNGDLMPYEKQVFAEGFESVLNRYAEAIGAGTRDTGVLKPAQDKAIQELLAVCGSLNGIDLTLDVGVDNVRPNVPFGTPWSMDDLRAHMAAKKSRWEARKDGFRNLVPVSALKGGDLNANPKF